MQLYIHNIVINTILLNLNSNFIKNHKKLLVKRIQWCILCENLTKLLDSIRLLDTNKIYALFTKNLQILIIF